MRIQMLNDFQIENEIYRENRKIILRLPYRISMGGTMYFIVISKKQIKK